MKTLLVAAMTIALAGCASEPPTVNTEQQTKDGLALIDNSKLDMAFVEPNVDWSQYSKIHFLPVQVTNDHTKDYKAPRIDVRTDGLDATYELSEQNLADLAATFEASNASVFDEDQPYELVQTKDANTLVVQIVVTDIRLSAPVESSRRSFQSNGRTYSQNAGSMLMLAQVYDGATNKTIARAADRAESIEQWQQNTRTFNTGEARTIYRSWLNDFKNALMRTHAQNSGN